MNELFDLGGKVAVVTGSSRGIGRAIVVQMARAGASVVVSSRKADACRTVADAITADGGEAHVIACNISRREDLDGLVDGTLERFGRIDCLVLNAASNPTYGPMAEADDAVFDKIMHNNVRSSLTLANRVAPHMAEGGGSIVIVGSIAGMAGSRNIGLYSVSKAADFQLARNLAVEWGHANVRINCIAPGLVRTDFARALWENPKALDFVERQTPLGRIGEPDDIAGIAVFLASDAARFITGQAIVADGGVSVRDPF